MANVAQSIIDSAITQSLRDGSAVTVESEDDCSRDDLIHAAEAAAEGFSGECYYGFGPSGHRWQVRVAS